MTCFGFSITFINKQLQHGRKSARTCWFFIISSLWSHLWPRRLLGARTECRPPGARGCGTSGSPRSQCSSPRGWSSEQTQSHTTWQLPPEIHFTCDAELKFYLCDENVLWLDISVETVVEVTEVDCLKSLPHNALQGKMSSIAVCWYFLQTTKVHGEALNAREYNR